MISYVCEQALKAQAEEVVVATDDQRIFDSVAQMGIEVMMTREDHNSGTERLFEVAESYGWSDETIVVNLQGDEPLIPPYLFVWWLSNWHLKHVRVLPR